MPQPRRSILRNPALALATAALAWAAVPAAAQSRFVGFYTEWSVYGHNYLPADIPADSLTHVIHGSGGIPHESVIGGGPGTTYTVTVNSSGTWYCHTHENSSLARTVTVIP